MIAEQKKALVADSGGGVPPGKTGQSSSSKKQQQRERTMGRQQALVVYPGLTTLGYFASDGAVTAPTTRWVLLNSVEGGSAPERLDAYYAHYAHYSLVVCLFARVGVSNRKVVEKLQDIPGVQEAPGWTPETHAMSQPNFKIRLPPSGRLVDPTPANLRQFESMLLDSINKEETLVWPFREPVDAKAVPDYYLTIKDPVDLGMLRRNIAGGLYVTLDLFVADVHRMFKNAKMFNGPESEYSKAAMKLMGMFDRWVLNCDRRARATCPSDSTLTRARSFVRQDFGREYGVRWGRSG
jgi:hypothetical protein